MRAAGCGCNEQVEKRINYEGDVAAAVRLGFSSVKMDSCGSQRNMTCANLRTEPRLPTPPRLRELTRLWQAVL